jgi:cell division protein FtsB
MNLRAPSASRWLLALAGAGAAVLAIGMVRGESSISSYYALEKSRGVMAKTVETLRAENQALNDEIVRLKESPSYAKKVLRDKYHVTDEDEDIIFFAE